MTAGTIVDDILDIMNRSENAAIRDRVWRILRLELSEICKEFSVAGLRDKTTIDFTSDAYSSGMLLPSDLFGVDMVRDSDNKEFIERNRADLETHEQLYRFYRYNPSTTAMQFGTDVYVTNEGTSFTSDSLDTWLAADATRTVDGEYICFGTEAPYYLIGSDTSPYTITPIYYGPTIRNGDYAIRPPETQRMVIIEPDEDVLQDRSMDIHYWKAPLGLYRPSDRIPLPSTEALTLRVLRRMPEAKEVRPVSVTEIDRAMAKLKGMNPNFPRPVVARGVTNEVMGQGVSPFKKR